MKNMTLNDTRNWLILKKKKNSCLWWWHS